jgi:hypothetical protein
MVTIIYASLHRQSPNCPAKAQASTSLNDENLAPLYIAHPEQLQTYKKGPANAEPFLCGLKQAN